MRRDPGPGMKERQKFDPSKCVSGRVRVQGGQGAAVARVQGLEQIEHFFPSAFPEQDPVRTHPQSLSEQIPDRDSATPVGIRGAGQQPDEVWMARSDFRSVFECDQAILFRNEAKEIRKQSCFPRSGAPRDHDGFIRLHRSDQEFQSGLIPIPACPGLSASGIDRGSPGKPPERKMNASRDQWGKGHMCTVSSEENSVHKRELGIPGPSNRGELIEDEPPEVGLIGESLPFRNFLHAVSPVDIESGGAVQTEVRDGRVLKIRSQCQSRFHGYSGSFFRRSSSSAGIRFRGGGIHPSGVPGSTLLKGEGGGAFLGKRTAWSSDLRSR